MSESLPSVSLYVKVDCNATSRHRDPQGIYLVDVVEDQSILHCANAAIQVVKDRVAFIDENIDKVTLKVFCAQGNEIRIPVLVETQFHDRANFRGRALDFPEIITLQ